MREFEFVVRFDEGASALMDVFRAHPRLTARTTECTATAETMWRVDHIRGPPEAIDAVEPVFTDESRCNECLDHRGCDTSREYQVLDRRADGLTVYTYREGVSACHFVPRVVHEHVGDGVAFEARRSGDAYRWKVLYRSERSVGELYDAIAADLRPGLSLEVSHLSAAGRWGASERIDAALSPEGRAALEAAAEAGYYERPRRTTVQELSDRLDVPRSTLQYRLRNAEDAVVSTFVGRG
ncbi:transcriptional regulator [Haloglomus irregulare]|jgi:hypothetical protein|uniref:Transcriptional regulator n=1 Tax=Haloglomus irregulare TaxID=2234134 RepID=A0A554MXE4_9EURY|nr:helix-turn-helix domain-containing protein [Haloglomus irregulare]TSD09808.1 transcriptional regulator [Haloglomus irregulare]